MGCEAVGNDEFNHIDFVFGIDADILVYKKITQFVTNATIHLNFIQDQIKRSLLERSERPPIYDEVSENGHSQNNQNVPRLALRGNISTRSENH